MKRILIALALLLPFSAMAQDRYDVPQTGTKVGLTRTGINSNFTFLFLAGTNAFRTAVEKGSNVNFVAKSPTNATQLDYCMTNGAGGGSDGNTQQGPWTNDVGGAGFALTGADYVQATNQAFFVVGTNIFAMQGWPDVTNVALNGQSLINAGYTWSGTNPITLAFGAGNTATVLRSDALLGRPFKVDVTSTPASITFEAGWPTNEIADVFTSIQKGTNSLTLVGATIIDSGRAGSTNVFLSSTNRTGVLFHKELGESKFYSIQVVP